MKLDEYIDRLTKELHQRVEHQRCVFKRLLGAKRAPEEPACCPLLDCPRLEELRNVLRETIGVLEETKGAFKSKRLEVMRKKLTDVLIAS